MVKHTQIVRRLMTAICLSVLDHLTMFSFCKISIAFGEITLETIKHQKVSNFLNVHACMKTLSM